MDQDNKNISLDDISFDDMFDGGLDIKQEKAPVAEVETEAKESVDELDSDAQNKVEKEEVEDDLPETEEVVEEEGTF